MWLVYVLKSDSKRWYYIGSTNRLKERLAEHHGGKVRSTKGYLPLQLVHTLSCPTEAKARQYERRLKDKRVEKEALIRAIEDG